MVTRHGRQTRLRAEIKRQRRTEQLRAAAKQVAEVMPHLGEMPLPDLVRVATQETHAALRTQARKCLAARLGLPWTKFEQKMERARRHGAHQRNVKLRQQYKKLPIPDLEDLLKTATADWDVVWDLLQEKYRVALEQQRRRQRMSQASGVPSPKDGKASSHSQEPTVGDFLKPLSREYDMPEYDLE
jgi:hypothetical protein